MEAAERNDIANENWNAYQRGLDAGHLKYVDLAKKCDAYYRGEQWDEADRQALADEGRPALTINAVKSAVNTVLGEYSEQRADISFKPRGLSLSETAIALSKQFQQIQDNNNYADREFQVFSDGLIQDRGFFDIRMGFEDNVHGEVRITAEDPIDIIPDPNAKDYDPRTWNEVIKTRWLTLDEISLFYGKKKAAEIGATANTEGSYGADSVRYTQQTFGDPDTYSMVERASQTNQIRRVRVIERQYYKLRKVRFFVDPNTGDERQVKDSWEDERAVAFAKGNDLVIHKRLAKNVRWTITADLVVLFDDWSPYKTFTIVPYFPYFRRGRPTGMVRDLLSPQEQLNKVESQQLHIVNTTANSGWVIESGSLVNMTEEELEKRGAETGLVLVTARNRERPEKIQPNQIPTGLDRLGSKALQNIREIAGVTSLLGLDSPEVSGVALEKKQSRGLVQMQVPFDNLRRTRQVLAEIALDLIQAFYTETRIVRATNYGTLDQETEEIVVNGMTPEGQIVNDLTLGEYDVVVASAPARDTFADTQFAEALNLRNAGVAVPDHWVLQYSHLSDKRDIAKEVRELQGLGEPTEEEMQMAKLQSDMQIQAAQLELQKLGAQIQELQTQAQLNAAKAEATTGEISLEARQQQLDAQLGMMKLQMQYDEKLRDLQNKVELATIHTEAKRQDTMFTTSSKRFADEMKLKTAAMQAIEAKRAPAQGPKLK